MLTRYRGTVSRYETKYPIVSHEALTLIRMDPCVNGSLERIASTSQAATKGHECSTPLLPTGANKTTQVFKPPVKRKADGLLQRMKKRR